MLGQFKNEVDNMYLSDKETLESYQKTVADEWSCRRDCDDPLEHFYSINLQPNTLTDRENVDIFNDILFQIQETGCSGIICGAVELSFTSTKCDQHITKVESIFPQSVVKDLAKATFNPLSLKHIAAAQAISALKHCKPNILIGVYNATKNQDLYIRVGDVNTRKNYKFANIVKQHIYKQTYEPLVTLQYFKNLELNPAPFCVHCGIIQKIDDVFCCCMLCDLFRGILLFTPIVEKPFHTTYHNCHTQCLK